jgi:hypothetical protein
MAVFLLRPTVSSLATPVLLRLLCSWRMREEPTHAFKRANTERERERERERESSRKQIRGRFVSNHLRYGVFWRRFYTEHFLSDLFSLIFQHVGSISIRILGFCFTEFSFSRSSLRRFAALSEAGFCGVPLPQLWICEHSGMFFPSCAYCYVFRFPCELACLTNVS